tara:strand:- start:4893 stop:5747 length:855 start_codon:yes stop_codon:yes gene_type:complete
MNILVTGVNGQLGSEIFKISPNYDYNWFFSDSTSFDMSDLTNIHQFLNSISPNIIINCAAYTSVNDAENNYELANILNHKSIKCIAEWCNKKKCKLIHISTDYVFDGKKNKPLNESDKTNPINNYGKTKLLGEKACIKTNSDSIIIRTSWLYSVYGNNFVKKIIGLMHQKDQISVINDQFGAPTYAANLAQVILKMIVSCKWVPGIYNYSSKANISWYDFAKDIKKIYGFNTNIIPVSSSEFNSLVNRPKFCFLDKTKIQKTYGVEIIPYMNSLRKCIKILKNE